MDISGNDVIENEIVSDDVSSNDTVITDVSGNVTFIPNNNVDDDYLGYLRETSAMENTNDYSPSLANIENLCKFQIAVIIGLLLCLCFILGWEHD